MFNEENRGILVYIKIIIKILLILYRKLPYLYFHLPAVPLTALPLSCPINCL